MSTNITFSLNNASTDTLLSYTFIGTNSGADIDVLSGSNLGANGAVSNSTYNIDRGKTTTFMIVFSTQHGLYQALSANFDITSSSSVTLVYGTVFGTQGDYQLQIGYLIDGVYEYSPIIDVSPLQPASLVANAQTEAMLKAAREKAASAQKAPQKAA